MSNSIRLSEKHGVNPSLIMCAFCGESKAIALVGKMDKADSEAPRQMIMDYEPCDKCQEQWSQGTALIGVTTSPNTKNQPPISTQPDGTSLYPTGSVLVIKSEVAKQMFNNPDMCDGYVTLADENILKDITSNAQRGEANE